MKKKIGCVIAYAKDHTNYGTSLQGYATLKKIQDMGYECEVIRYNKQLSFIDKVVLIIQMWRCGATKGKLSSVKDRVNKLVYKHYAHNIALRTHAVNRYKEQKIIPLFKEYNGFKSLCEGSINYDAVLVGSDQVWTPMSLYGKYYNLLFVDDKVPKIAYASSFGVSKIPPFQWKGTKRYLDRFHRIGVRENSGKEIVEAISDNTAKVVVDPTMLLMREEWEKEIVSSVIEVKEPFIFCYLLGTDPNTRKAVMELKKRTGLKVVAIRHMDEYVSTDEKFGDYAPYNVSPNDFVKYISEAQYVCTDSFHCTVFSILFHKKFITFYRFRLKNKGSRNSRIDSLFNLLGLQKRLFDKNIYEAMVADIDFEEVDNKLNKMRRDSLQFLSESLSSGKFMAHKQNKG